MPMVSEEFLWHLLQACAAVAPQPLYPVHYARQTNLDRDLLDAGLDELRHRGLVKLTEWVKGHGQGCALTEAGEEALTSSRLRPALPAEALYGEPGGGPVTAYERGEIIRSAFLEQRPPYASRTLLVINVLFFLYGAYVAWRLGENVGEYLDGSGKATELVLEKVGALSLHLVFQSNPPRYERILVSSFLHIGLLHLFMNMYFLGSLGPLIERIWGTYRFLAIYFVAALVSGCVVLQIGLLQGRSPPTAGASGALYGIFISLIVWFSLNKDYLPPLLIQDWSRSLGINMFLLLAINFFPNISWQGHFGGAVGGLLASLLLHVHRFHPNSRVRMLALAGVPLIPVAFFVVLLWQAGRL
jgi:rhomboid protease GluP